MTYFNTTNEEGSILKEYETKASNQDILIATIYHNQNRPLSPSMVESILLTNGITYPLTSIRRSITNLTNAGKLQKLERKTIGKYKRS